MKFRHLPACAAPFAAAVGFLLLSIPAAQAFTFEDQSATTNGGSANLSDPTDRMTSRYNSGNQTVIKQGDTTFRFGGQPQSFDQRYNTDNLFNPNGRPGDTYGR